MAFEDIRRLLVVIGALEQLTERDVIRQYSGLVASLVDVADELTAMTQRDGDEIARDEDDADLMVFEIVKNLMCFDHATEKEEEGF